MGAFGIERLLLISENFSTPRIMLYAWNHYFLPFFNARFSVEPSLFSSCTYCSALSSHPRVACSFLRQMSSWVERFVSSAACLLAVASGRLVRVSKLRAVRHCSDAEPILESLLRQGTELCSFWEKKTTILFLTTRTGRPLAKDGVLLICK